MKTRITFGKALNVGAGDLDGVVLTFPFTVSTIHEGAERDTIAKHTISVEMTGSLQTKWGLGNTIRPLENQPLLKTAFEYARRKVQADLRSGNLQPKTEIQLHTEIVPQLNPYDPSKIPDPEGLSFELDLTNHIGF